MATPLTERDLITLNEYLDGALTPAETQAFEARLADEPALRGELDTLRDTVSLLGMAESVPVPRNFTLNPAEYARPARRSFFSQLSTGTVGVLAGAAAMIVVALFAGVFLLGGAGSGGAMSAAEVQDVAATEFVEAQVEGESIAMDMAEAEVPAEGFAGPEEAEAAPMDDTALEGSDAAEPQPTNVPPNEPAYDPADTGTDRATGADRPQSGGGGAGGDSGAADGSNGDLPIGSADADAGTYFPPEDPFAGDDEVAESPEESDEDMGEVATNTAANDLEEPVNQSPSFDGAGDGDLAEPPSIRMPDQPDEEVDQNGDALVPIGSVLLGAGLVAVLAIIVAGAILLRRGRA